jgi:hypothetical protein
MPGRRPSQPLADRSDEHGRLESDGELVEAAGDGSVALEAIDPAPLVALAVERRRPAARAATALAVADLVGRLGNGAGDTASAQVVPIGPGGIGLVASHPIRSGARAAGPVAGHAYGFEHRGELRRVAALGRRDQDGQRLLALLAGQVDLRGQPAPGPAESVIGRLGGQAARRFLLGLAVPARPGGVLVSPADRGVDVHRPSDATVRVGSRLELGEQPCPHAQALRAAEQSVDRLPGPIARVGGHATEPRSALATGFRRSASASTWTACPSSLRPAEAAPARPIDHLTDLPAPREDHHEGRRSFKPRPRRAAGCG